MTTATRCKHVPVDSLERGPFGFTACVARHPYTHCQPISHGGAVFVEVCECGAERRRLSNGRRTEYGIWEKP